MQDARLPTSGNIQCAGSEGAIVSSDFWDGKLEGGSPPLSSLDYLRHEKKTPLPARTGNPCYLA
jgi:hypothetical protein